MANVPFPAYRGREPYAFISYSHMDSEAVFEDITAFHGEGDLPIWYDEGIELTREWPEQIENALRACTIFVLFLSPHAVASVNVRNEINLAMSLGKHIMPIYLSQAELQHGLALQIGAVQGIFRFSLSRNIYLQKCSDTIHGALGSAQNAPEAQGMTVDGVCYRLCEGIAEVVGTDGLTAALAIRESILGSPVTRVAESAFAGNHTIETVTLPGSLVSIGSRAFADCTRLRSLSPIPDSVLALGNGVFFGCSALTEVVLGASITQLSAYYERKSIGEIALYGAFANCTALVHITLPASLSEIGVNAFAGCAALKQLTLPKGLTLLDESALEGCNALERIDVENNGMAYASRDGVLTDARGERLLRYPPGCPDQSYSIAPGIREIAEGAFAGAMYLQRVVCSAQVTVIPELAFAHCPELTAIDLPGSVCVIDSRAFLECPKLHEVCLPDGLKVLRDGAFMRCGALEEIVIPVGITAIAARTFYECERLASAKLCAGVKTFAFGCFGKCPKLVLVAPVGSAAAAYAQKQGIPCRSDL